jgi:hypothetical protein
MNKQLCRQGWLLFVCLSLALLMIASVGTAQEGSDEELKKKYAPILGEYEFDLTEYGGEVIVLKIHVESGDLWGDSGDGKPITLEQIEGGEFEFTADDPDSGALEIKFLKNDEGEYTLCRIMLVDQGLEIEGMKLK